MMSCKDCQYWGEDATQFVCSARMRVCTGLHQEWEPREGFTDGTKILKKNSAIVEEVEFCGCEPIDPKFITGPDFGCNNFKELEIRDRNEQ